MSVLKGEGKVPILFGTKSVVAGALTHETYLARPDLTGEWPTVVLVPDAWGITSAVKDVARRLAREGIACIAVDVFRGAAPARSTPAEAAAASMASVPVGRIRRDVADVIRYIINPAGFWSSAEDGFAVAGLGEGGPHAIALAVRHSAALVLAGAGLTDDIGTVTTPVLGLYGRDDEIVAIDDVMEARSAVPHAEWVLYDGVGHRFMDDYLEGFDFGVYRDAVERIADFCSKHLPSPR